MEGSRIEERRRPRESRSVQAIYQGVLSKEVEGRSLRCSRKGNGGALVAVEFLRARGANHTERSGFQNSGRTEINPNNVSPVEILRISSDVKVKDCWSLLSILTRTDKADSSS
jgi:hypothetical protein